jgi:hypothetical protein
MNSILDTIKKMLGIDSEYMAFDTDIIVDINAAFMSLTQLGIGPPSGFSIQSRNDEWSSFIGTSTSFEADKTYIYLKVKSVFDPPTSSTVLESMERRMAELEWRLNLQVETPSAT